MSTRDIKANLIERLSAVQQMVNSGDSTEADYQLSDIIDSMLSSMVSVTYSHEDVDSRPGDCEDASELVARNID